MNHPREALASPYDDETRNVSITKTHFMLAAVIFEIASFLGGRYTIFSSDFFRLYSFNFPFRLVAEAKIPCRKQKVKPETPA